MQEGPSEIIGSYAKWHYGGAIKELLNILRNINRFLYHFFSVKLLLKTWVSPWRRMHEDYKPGLSVGHFLSSLLVNTIMRIVGFVFRSVILLIGLVFLICALLTSASLLLLWLFFPIILLAIFASAIILIISAT